MKLIEKELAAKIMSSSEFECVNADESWYKDGHKNYILTKEDELYEAEESDLEAMYCYDVEPAAEETEVNDESTDMESVSEEA